MKQDIPLRGPLAGVRILEFRGIGPAPFALMLLADMGAEILQIFPPGQASGMPVPEHDDPILRGRSRLAVDLKQPGSSQAILGLLGGLDVIVEGFRPGVMERMGLGPDECLKRNPALVFGRMSGWGQEGPLSLAPSHDPNMLAVTGVLHSMGYADRPPLPPLNLVGDYGGGSMFLVAGVLAALLHARACGEGQVVDAAMVDGVAALMAPAYAMRNHGLWSDKRGVNFLDGSCPFGTSYETADGRYMMVAAIEPPFYAALLKGLGLDAADLPGQYERKRWPEMRQRFAGIFKTRSRDEWTALLETAGACTSPVLDMTEAPRHFHNAARGVFVGDDNPLPAAAPRFQKTPTAHAPRDLGSADRLLARWGVATEAVAALLAVASTQ